MIVGIGAAVLVTAIVSVTGVIVLVVIWIRTHHHKAESSAEKTAGMKANPAYGMGTSKKNAITAGDHTIKASVNPAYGAGSAEDHSTTQESAYAYALPFGVGTAGDRTIRGNYENPAFGKQIIND